MFINLKRTLMMATVAASAIAASQPSCAESVNAKPVNSDGSAESTQASTASTDSTAAGSSQPTSAAQSGDIVVTAQRRAESIQTAPVAVTAFSGETIANYGIKSFEDYAKSVPGLSYSTGGSASTATQGYGVSSTRQVTIRGVAGVSTTSLYVDDTPIPAAVDVRVLDLERIEVLRGPQGTLFGAASMGGTIKLVTKQPDLDNYTGTITVRADNVDHGGAGYDASAALNIPLIKDNLALRVSAYSTYDPGYYTKIYGVAVVPGLDFLPGEQATGEDKHIGGTNSFGGVASLSFAPQAIPQLHVTAMAIYQSTRIDGYPVAIGNPLSYDQPQPLNLPENSNSEFQFYSLTARYGIGFGNLISSTSYFHRISTENTDATAFVAYISPIDYGTTSPYLPATADVTYNQKILTQEVRFESTFNSKFQVITGAFYQRTSNGYDYALNGTAFDSTGTAGPEYYRENAPNIQTQLAAFANVTLDVTSKFSLAAGARVARQTSSTYDYLDASGYPITYTVTHQKETPVTPRFLAQYKFDRSNMIYASAAKGYRPGGTNNVIEAACNPEAYGFKEGSANPFNSDSLWSYEAGLKNSFADHKIVTRLAGYHINWSNIQQSVYIPSCAIAGTQNVGQAKIDGGEAEVTIMPVAGLSINGALGYTNARITQAGVLSSGNVVGAAVGQPLNGVPKWNGSVRTEYTQKVGKTELFIRAQYSYTGKSVSFANGYTPRARYQLVDLRTGANIEDWTVSLFANNVFDVKPNLGDITQLSGQLPGLPQYIIGTPRTIGLELRRNF